MSDPRQLQHLTALAAASALVLRLDPAPGDFHVSCHPWSPTEASITMNAHRDLPTVAAWAAELGTELISRPHGDSHICWSFTTTVAGVAVEGYTLLSLDENRQQAGGVE